MSFRFPLLLAAILCVQAAFGQSVRVTAQTPTGFAIVTDGSTVPVQSNGRETTTAFSIFNAGTAPVTINQVLVTGSDFALTAPPVLPATLSPNASLTFGVRYTPVAGRTSTAQASVQYTEASTARQTSFTLLGTAPDYAFTVTAPDGRRSTVTPGTRISFGSVRPGTPVTYTLSVANRGTGAGTLTNILVSGRDFTAGLSGTQSIPAGQEIQIPVTFNPQTRGVTSGTLSLDLGISTASFGLDGAGAAPEFIFGYALRSDGNARPLADGGRLTFSATPATTSAIAEVVIGNQGNGVGTVRSVVLEGAAFQMTGLPLLPANVEPGSALRFNIQFTPPRPGSYTGALRIQTDERTVSVIVEGVTAEPTLTLAYVDPQSRNTLPIPNEGTLAFPLTAVDATVVYPVVLQNTGTGTAFINSVGVQGDAFALVDLPSLPATVLPGRDFRFGVRFNPKQRQFHTGLLQIETASGMLTARLAGQGSGPALSVQAADPDMQPQPVGTELAFSAAVGQSATKTVLFTNTGNSDAEITAISVTGAGFQLNNVPFLPLTLRVGDSQTFTVLFAPTQPGASRGRLRIGDQFFDVAGNGLAPRLDFSYTNEAGTTAVAEGDTVVLTPARVGESSRIDFALQNTGTTSAVISAIDITPPNAAFAVESTPPLPLNLEPGASLRFAIRFVPTNVGAQTAVLRINNSAFNLSGNARPPVPLPGYQIQGPSGTQQPLGQPAVGVTLESPYPLPIRGTLTLTFLSDVFSENPAVQFSSGGRVAPFTIPAGSTVAVFDSGATEVRLQTGTVAGTIQLRANFATQTGLDLTPTDAPSLTLTIARSTPQLLTAEVASRARTGLTLLVTGYSTTRELRQMTVNIAPRSGDRVANGTVTINLQPVALVWFQSTNSQGFGGLFSLQVPLTFQRGNSDEDLVSRIESLTITVTNEMGASNAVTVGP